MRSLTIFAVIFSVSLAFVVVQNTVVTQNNNIIECEGCKIAVKLIDDGVDLGIDAGIDIFIKLCEDVIPGKVGKVECKKFADNDLEKIIHALEHGTDPKDVCHDLNLCKK